MAGDGFDDMVSSKERPGRRNRISDRSSSGDRSAACCGGRRLSAMPRNMPKMPGKTPKKIPPSLRTLVNSHHDDILAEISSSGHGKPVAFGGIDFAHCVHDAREASQASGRNAPPRGPPSLRNLVVQHKEEIYEELSASELSMFARVQARE